MTLTAKLTVALSIVALGATGCMQQRSIQVLVWDERQPKQKQVYENFLGNHIAEDLRRQGGLSVRSAGMDDPQQGLSDELLDNCDVLIWWGHRRQADSSIETAQRIVDRVKTGKLNLIILHSAHWCTPFILAMHERARQDALATLPSALRDDAKVEWLGEFERKAPAPDAELTPSVVSLEKTPDGSAVLVQITRPNCCFPYYKAHGKPSKVKTLLPTHPIAAGIPKEFTIPQTEMYGEPFHVSRPDEVIFEERWEDGKWFRAGALWNVGDGKVFYFRPGHENFSVYLQPEPLKIIANATRYLAKQN
ncbi:MAG: ThuA domain-containing protein [Planctomycetota bacterium]|jgi:trehalose utilization protein